MNFKRVIMLVAVLYISGYSGFQESEPESNNLISVFVARPDYFGYGEIDTKTLWISAVTEVFLSYKLSGSIDARVLSPDMVSEEVYGGSGYDRRVSKTVILPAVRNAGATHILYSEYEPLPEEKVSLYVKLVRVSDKKTMGSAKVDINLKDIQSSLNRAALKIFRFMGIAESEISDDVLSFSVLGEDIKVIRKFGDMIVKAAQENPAQRAEITETVMDFDGNGKSIKLASFAASRIYARSGRYEKACRAVKKFIDDYASSCYPLYLDMARYCRLSGDYDRGLSVLDGMPEGTALDAAVIFERGKLYAAMEKYKQAISIYSEYLDQNKGGFLFNKETGKLWIQSGNDENALTYIRKAAEYSNTDADKLLLRIGNEFEEKKNLSAAERSYFLAASIDSSNTSVWLRLADLKMKTGKKKDAAESYLKLFRLDYIKYKEYLSKAGRLFEEAGMKERAKNEYLNFLQVHKGAPRITIRLANLELMEDNCMRVRKLLEPLSEPWASEEEVRNMLEECPVGEVYEKARIAHSGENDSKENPFGEFEGARSKRKLFIGIPAAVTGLGGIAGGMAVNFLKINPGYKDYKNEESSQSRVEKLHDELEKQKLLRNILYIIGAAGGIGFTLNISIPDRK